MKYKRITNRAAIDLFLLGDSKLRISTVLCGPVPVSPETLAKAFAEGSKSEFYIEQETKQAVGYAAVLTDDKYGRTLSGFVVADLLQDFTLGTNVKVTIEEIV